MKDNLENVFKSKLEEYEVPYDPKAWDTVNSQLNANAAAGGSALSSAFKWVLATVLLGTVVTGSYFLWNNDGEPNKIETAIVSKEKQEEPSSIKPQDEQTKEDAILIDSAENVKSEQLVETKKDVSLIVNEEGKLENKNEQILVEEPIKAKVQNKKEEKNTPPVVPVEDAIKTQQFVAGLISNPIVCIGETVEITNPSENGRVRFQVNSEWIELKANKSFNLTLKESVLINFVNDKNELIEAKYVKVYDASIPDFNLEANVYEEGLPVVIAEAYGDFSSYLWSFDGEVERKGAIVKHNFFDKGEYEISLKVTDANGCESKTSKTIRIRDKYNLMAVDAFKPNGSDARNRAFMPYSLTERDVRFQLTIVDPIDNGVVFTSTDSDESWDGTDQRTGKMTPSNKSFIWKVQIFNPEMNERPIYAGTVVHN